MMTPKQFIDKYMPYALFVEAWSGIKAESMITQSAAENGWKVAKGNMMFGVKDIDRINGNEQLIRTKEILPTPTAKFPVIHSITPFVHKGVKMYKYDCETWFRKYDSPEESFDDYATFILSNPCYKKALAVKSTPELYLREIARAKYATGLNYEEYLISVLNSVMKRL